MLAYHSVLRPPQQFFKGPWTLYSKAFPIPFGILTTFLTTGPDDETHLSNLQEGPPPS